MARAKVVFYVTGTDDDGDHFKHDWQQCVVDLSDVTVSAEKRQQYATFLSGEKLDEMVRLEEQRMRREAFQAAGTAIMRALADAFKVAA